MSVPMVNGIGEYQLGNLISNGVPFLFLYVQASDEAVPSHPLLKNAVACAFDGLVQFVENKTQDLSHPMVLICQDGRKSFEAASTLIVAGYINVFAVQGGVNELA